MKSPWIAITALMLGACSGALGTTHSVTTAPLFNDTTIGGPNYPVVISGAEQIGISEQMIAQNLRFPARLRAESSFQAVKENPALVNHAHLDIGPNGSSRLTFLHGDREIGVGSFSLPVNAYADPNALGSISATLIKTMLLDSEENLRGNDNRRKSF